jgi:hypothetical protein
MIVIPSTSANRTTRRKIRRTRNRGSITNAVVNDYNRKLYRGMVDLWNFIIPESGGIPTRIRIRVKRVIQSMTTKKQQTPSTDRQQKPKVRIYLCNMCKEEVIYIPTESVDIGGLVFVRHLEKKHADFYDKLKAQRKASGLAANKGGGTDAIDTGTARQVYFTYKKSRDKTEADDNIELF